MNTTNHPICQANEGVTLYTSRHHTADPSNQWYAAFREPNADDWTPELGWGEGLTRAEAVAAAEADYRANNS